jgi:hypothetical protein
MTISIEKDKDNLPWLVVDGKRTGEIAFSFSGVTEEFSPGAMYGLQWRKFDESEFHEGVWFHRYAAVPDEATLARLKLIRAA